MTLISKNPIKIILMVILLYLAYNLYSNDQGNTISYLLIVLGLYLIYNDKTLEGLVNTDYENPEITRLLNLQIQNLFGTSSEKLSEEQVKQQVDVKVKEIIETNQSLITEQAKKQADEKLLKFLMEGRQITDPNDPQVKADFEKNKDSDMYKKLITDEEEKIKKASVEIATELSKKALVEQESKKETSKTKEEVKEDTDKEALEQKLKMEQVLGKALETKTKSDSKALDERLKELIESRQVKMDEVVKTNPKTEEETKPDTEAAIAKAVAPLQAEIAKLREQTAVPPNVMEAKLKTFNLLVDFLTEKGTLTEEDYENMKVKMSSNVMTIDEAIDSLERLKLASKTVKRKEVQPEMKNWWSEMNRSELPLDMYIPKGSLVPSQFNNEFTILNTDKWTVPMPRPPVCIDSTPKDILPMGTTGYPTGLKYFDEARYVTTGSRQEKEKKMVAFDIKQAKKEPVKESFTDTKKENCGCSD
jgi:hypothetical protein